MSVRTWIPGLLSVLVMWPLAADAQPASPAPGTSSSAGDQRGADPLVAYADGDVVHVVRDIGGKSTATELIRTGTGPITRFTLRGRSALMDKSGQIHWARLPDVTGQAPVVAATSQLLDCRPPARISTTGQWLVCTGQDGAVRAFDTSSGAARPLALPAAVAAGAIAGIAGERLLLSDAGELWSVSLGQLSTDATRQLAAPNLPESQLFGSPDGTRAVGWFSITKKTDEAIPTLHTFRLDGRGVRRRLMKRAVPVAWSRDGSWLLVQRDKRACLVRAVGGHYKCWRGFMALDISAGGERLLLGRWVDPDAKDETSYSLKGYRGERGIVAVRDDAGDSGGGAEASKEDTQNSALRVYAVGTSGVQPARPKVVVKGVDGPAGYLAP